MASFLIVKNASLATTYSDVCTAYMMYIRDDEPINRGSQCDPLVEFQ